MFTSIRSHQHRAVGLILRALVAGSLLILMSAIHQDTDDSGSHYIHPRHAMQ
ncbi:uncharacterized protein DMAD_05024 [Drosophila madeirensis]|uniref:Uncharacterized protein n=1 Tax=Drosophila madeirensis TaxID=30013 RepID=A0AAU9GCN6_DROMD|nr:uncharacterized protein LOC111078210 [Drosophila obscura]XP_034141472.1 uncharacterized protein LOC117592074 [Drosophila guanche]XP_034652168.1 uncharacterized protein LOC117891094 [Drosophila subobscura]